MAIREVEIRDWFLSYQLPDAIARNHLAMSRWELAMSDMSIGKIWSFYVCADIPRYEGDKFEYLWSRG